MNFMERIIGTITSPDKAMEDVAKEPRWEEALVIMGVYAVIYALYAYLYSTHTKYVYTTNTPGIEAMGPITVISTIVAGLIMPLIYWLIATVVLFLLSMAFGGEGKFTTLLTGIGFSNLVKIFAIIIALILATQAPYITITMDPSNPLGAVSQATSLGTNIYMIASQIVLLLGLIWSCIIGIFGLKHCQKLSFRSAAIVVGIPAVIYIIISYSAMFLMMLK
ncbi:MAG TPA: Yip1 family protein [Methanocella sp.]|nr:Yip1 family protein [Methanocella sp.]